MEARYLEQAIPFLKKMEMERKDQFIKYFKTAPVWLLESFSVEEMEKGTAFVRCYHGYGTNSCSCAQRTESTYLGR